jgi:UDP-N-acetylmuramoyl-L-alanyl-D-glutamate--2,6-diaminopimelate ligase
LERNPAVLLSDILRELDSRVITGDTACEVTSVEFNSKNVSGGSIFVAIIGFNNDGHSYIGDAIAQGASCVIVDSERKGLGEEELAEMVAGTKCVVAEMKDTKKALALAAASLYGHPEKQIDIYGITGTKGKTTSTFMLRSILEAAGKKAGLIGTVCNIIGDEKVNSVHTTPESSNIFSMMRSLRDKDISNLVMEVSSQGLKLDRVYGISYKAAAFTNLFEDHIGKNEHPDMALVLGAVVGDKQQLLICLGQNRVDAGKNAGTIIRTAGKEIQGGGGGQPAYATAGGKNAAGLDNAIALAVKEIEG